MSRDGKPENRPIYNTLTNGLRTKIEHANEICKLCSGTFSKKLRKVLKKSVTDAWNNRNRMKFLAIKLLGLTP